ncbi:uncharacterized protein LOC109594491 isoform X2 [Aethina tumida]|uniref:uncharacterized protein LOC109594491 isoform X2 n=1 Tax=Aethina tumida TaxID=116153 RepID=UPI0021486355|nr:uncharacterized protein LOC109594491 isoform X2 [Aethina tumida]
MPDESYVTWVNIFDKDLTKAYSEERKELKGCAMILCALQKEFEKIRTSVQSQYNDIRKELEQKDEHIEKKMRLSLNSKENTPPIKHPTEMGHSSNSQQNTPDFFEDLNSSELNAADVIDLSKDDSDDLSDCPSPPFSKRKNINRTNKLSPSLCFMTKSKSNTNCDKTELTPPIMNKTNLNESTIIANTPEVRLKKNKSLKSNLFQSKKKPVNGKKHVDDDNNLTMTQFFPKEKKKSDSQDSFINELVGNKSHPSVLDDKTCEDKSTMEITTMLDFINRDEEQNEQSASDLSQATVDDTFFDMDITSGDNDKENSEKDQENLNFLCSFSNDEPEYQVPTKKNKLDKSLAGPNKKNDEAKLDGWSCDNCRKFYGCVSLPPDMLKKKMIECTKHKKKQLEETIPGFWDMSLRTQEY